MKKIIIAIDGPSASGKSTLAKDLAAQLGYIYVDSGAMYRAVTLFFLQHHIPLNKLEMVQHALEHITIRFERDERGNRTFLNGQEVEDAIRQMQVSEMVSPVSAIPAVRVAMVQQQQAMGKHKGIVMDGRDIGTVVFPDAELKFFVTADLEARAQRRYAELIKKNQQITFEEVLENLRNRDHIDSTRTLSPLRKANNAFEIDNTHLNREEQLKLALELAQPLLHTQSE